MRLITRISELLEIQSNIKPDQSVGLVPTMGALHSGHIELIMRSIRENDISICSIFVNPTQFNNSTDLKNYPRTLESDLRLLEEVNCDYVFAPPVEEMYPKELVSEKIDLGKLDTKMEGEHRPGHFQGMATIVKKLLEVCKPQRAYFGEKDYQQYRIIKYFSAKLFPGIEILGHPTQRSEQGLALSSRNALLSEEGKINALGIFKSLSWARSNYQNYTPAELEQKLVLLFKDSPLDLEYVKICDEDTLSDANNWNESKHCRVFIAAFLSGVRLIDNLPLF